MTKRIFCNLIAVMFIFLYLTAGSSNVFANVFASDVTLVNPDGSAFDGNLNDGTNAVGIQFRLNENATSVVITISDGGGVVRTLDAGPQAQGLNVVVWHGDDDSGSPVAAGDYTFTVTANDANGHAGYDVIYARSGTSIFTRGGTTIRNPAAPNFGHPIGGNGGGAGLKRGPLNFFADGTGFEFDEPGLSRYSPFEVRDLGGTGRLYMLTSDDDGYLYYSDRLDPLSKVFRFSPSLEGSSLTVVTTVADSSQNGLGIDVVGSGAAKTIYWGVDNEVWRGVIGEADTFDPANFELVAQFAPDGDTANIFIRDLVIDDSGFLYVSLRTGGEPTGENPGLAVERYDISGTLPVARTDRNWTIPVGFDNGDGRPVGFGLDRGTDLASNADDRVYFSGNSGTKDNNWNTMRKIDDLATGGSTVVFEDISGSGTTSSNADMSVDAAGNLIWFENSSEWIIAVSPPDGANSYTTPANDVITIDEATTANAFPNISSVEDVPNDQGNQVLVSWSGSFLDRVGTAGIEDYEVYRQIGGSDGTASIEKRTFLNGPPGEWEQVGETAARQAATYNLTVPTLYNETPDGTIESTFFVSAVGADGTRWDSGPASGFSIDNLVPTAPTNLAAREEETAEEVSFVRLTWDESADEDFNYFTIVRGAESGFDPNAAEEIGTTTEPTLVDDDVTTGQTLFYRVAAFDFNGNRGEFSDEVSLLITSVNGDAGSTIPTSFALQQNYPNPFNPNTQISYDLPNDVNVVLKIYNMVGQEVRTLVNEQKTAGAYTATWDGRSNAGSKVASGVYLYVLRAGQFVQTKKMTLVK